MPAPAIARTQPTASPAAWTAAVNAAISVNCSIDAPVLEDKRWVARAKRTNDQNLVDLFTGEGDSPDASLRDLVANIPDAIGEPPRATTAVHCPTCSCRPAE